MGLAGRAGWQVPGIHRQPSHAHGAQHRYSRPGRGRLAASTLPSPCTSRLPSAHVPAAPQPHPSSDGGGHNRQVPARQPRGHERRLLPPAQAADRWAPWGPPLLHAWLLTSSRTCHHLTCSHARTPLHTRTIAVHVPLPATHVPPLPPLQASPAWRCSASTSGSCCGSASLTRAPWTTWWPSRRRWG